MSWTALAVAPLRGRVVAAAPVGRTMRHQLIARTWAGTVAVVGLGVLTLAIGLCLFDGDHVGTASDHSSPDLCGGLALFSFAVTLLGLVAVWQISPAPARPLHATAPRCPAPPPKSRLFF